MSTDRENQAGANTAGQSELIEPLDEACGLAARMQDHCLRDMYQMFIDKGNLLLTVKVETFEQVDELMQWLYAPQKSPLQTQLIEVAWDKVAMPRDKAEALTELLAKFGVV